TLFRSGVDSDLFFTAKENKDTFKKLAHANSNVTYGEIHSLHGHDAFLIEFNQMEELLKGIFDRNGKSKKVKVLKFGGKSLANGQGLNAVLRIISGKVNAGERIAVVVSARNKATDELEAILEKAAKGLDYSGDFKDFGKYQRSIYDHVDISEELNGLEKLFGGVALLGDYSLKVK